MSNIYQKNGGQSATMPVGLNILNRIKLNQKFILVLTALLLPIALLIFMLVAEKSASIEFTEKELKGLEYVVQLRQLQQHLAEHRGMTNAFKSGAFSMKARLDNKRVELAKDFKALDVVDARLGKELEASQSLTSIKGNWRSLSTQVQSMDNTTAFSAHSSLIEEVISLTSLISDTSNLILDQQLDSFYLMDLIINKIPKTANNGGILRGLASGVAGRQNITASERNKLSNLVTWINGLAKNVSKAIVIANRYHSQNNIGKSISKEAAQAPKKLAQFTKRVEREIISTGNITVTSKSLFNEGTTALSSTFSLYDEAAPILTSLLKHRISEDKKMAFIQIAASLAFILVAVILTLIIMRSITRPLAKTIEVFSEISNGNFHSNLIIKGRDEIAQVQHALLSMQQNLKETKEQEQIVAIETNRIKLALTHVTSNVTVSDGNNKVIFINDAAKQMLADLATNKTRNNGAFNADDLIGTPLADFFPGNTVREIYSSTPDSPQKASFEEWGRNFNLAISPVYDENKNYQGRITQWTEVTEELQAEQEIDRIVSAANNGDLSERISTDGHDGFFKDLATGLNELVDGVDQVISGIASAMKNVAEGDLTQPISQQYTGTYESVKNSVNDTIQNGCSRDIMYKLTGRTILTYFPPK